MTREEAISYLEIAVPIKALTQEEFNRFIEALNMAIKALEQEPCEDCISRQAVIDGIDTYINKTQSTGTRDDFISFAELVVKDLPSVNPQDQKWIHVSERLPNHEEYIKNNGLFNVSDGNRSYSEWFDIYKRKRFGEPTMSGFRVDYAVIAWMPLPDPYKA